ncbi:hypothetical protein INT47_011527 [Mucor saturninus]|uniref:DDE Tnp4 domain-containing protein n=1 Tax=Mucor saturninus TaxID=64648 RepID=A0A8H7QH44_9FUNG|nr:hypothetical protein INT47_011527 [Mucor saturninus]
MGKDAIENLVNELSNHEESNFAAPNAIPVYIQVATALFRLDNYHAIKRRLGYLLAWPTDPEAPRAVAHGFGSDKGQRLNSAMGVVDGKNFMIHKPSPDEFGAMFLDRKNDYSIKRLRTHNAAAFRSSDINYGILESPETFFSENTFIIGDSAYPLGPNLITPFPESQCIPDSRKRTINFVHSATRMAIEKAFGVLVAR